MHLMLELDDPQDCGVPLVEELLIISMLVFTKNRRNLIIISLIATIKDYSAISIEEAVKEFY